MIQCGICPKQYMREDMTHLPIYVVGSEGIMVCLECRMLITEYVRGLRQLSGKVRLLMAKENKGESNVL